jgi:hypothetical protein
MECQKLKDSLDDFKAGPNVPNSSKELDFVMDPYETTEGWQNEWASAGGLQREFDGM